MIPIPNIYFLGSMVRVVATFTYIDGGNADPTTVSIKALDPLTKQVVVGAPVRDAEGVWHADFLPEASGRWAYAATGTGAVVASGQGEFEVAVQEIP